MKINKYTTVPNIVFDKYLFSLSCAELKLLLVVIRQTIGWTNGKTTKAVDWISFSFFESKTGLSRKSIYNAINSLLEKELIIVLDSNMKTVVNSSARRGSKRLYFAYAPYYRYLLFQNTVNHTINIKYG